jgi:hypothetical protein
MLQKRHLRFAVVLLVIVAIAVRTGIASEDAVGLRTKIRIGIEIVRGT